MNSRFKFWTFSDHVLTAWSKRFITWDGYFSAAVDHYEGRSRAPFPQPHSSDDDEPEAKEGASALLRGASRTVWNFAHRIANTRPPPSNPRKTTNQANLQRAWVPELDDSSAGEDSRRRAGYEVSSPFCRSIKVDRKMEDAFAPSPRGSDFYISAWRAEEWAAMDAKSVADEFAELAKKIEGFAYRKGGSSPTEK